MVVGSGALAEITVMADETSYKGIEIELRTDAATKTVSLRVWFVTRRRLEQALAVSSLYPLTARSSHHGTISADNPSRATTTMMSEGKAKDQGD